MYNRAATDRPEINIGAVYSTVKHVRMTLQLHIAAEAKENKDTKAGIAVKAGILHIYICISNDCRIVSCGCRQGGLAFVRARRCSLALD